MAEIYEASPICRGKNLSWETVLLFFNNMPRESMPKAEFHSFVESKINGWTQTHSQIARQLAFYYEKDGVCYPRFIGKVSYADLFLYMQNWASKYFIPNPYAPSLKGKKPTCIYSFVRKSILDGNKDFDNVLDAIFDIKLSSHDKVNVYLSNFTDIIIDDGHKLSLSERTMFKDAELYPNEDLAFDVEKYYNYFSIQLTDKADNVKLQNRIDTLQQIFYGAPGTGKSHAVKMETETWEKEGRVVRTTFHPDSDYSTFVGAYKPTTESVQRYDIYNKPMTRDGVPVMEQIITYEFVEQAFLQAYIDAWTNREEPEFLIIEEINRGNCAQIFGDLFQLLDRGDDGYSEYPIRADKDLQKHLCKAFKNVEIEDYPNVKAGKELLLPSNLYIRATMNTSDQSLFPIDSAFKRRWDWKYVPIAKGNDNGLELNWMIDVDGDLYDWWTFVRTINKHVFDTTNSEDKQLGFFFCKAKDNIISAETFVCKVIFYLWNDVFKDFGFDNKIFEDKEDNENPKLSFDKFYMANGNVNEEKIRMFFENIGMMPIEEATEEVDDDYSVKSNGKTIPRYSINGSVEQFSTPNAVRYVIENYAKQNENISVDEMIQLWNGIAERNNLLVPTWQPSPNDNQPFASKRRVKIEWGACTAWLVTGWTETLFKKFIQNVKQKLDINIVRVN